jgi:hypothetical protein
MRIERPGGIFMDNFVSYFQVSIEHAFCVKIMYADTGLYAGKEI